MERSYLIKAYFDYRRSKIKLRFNSLCIGLLFIFASLTSNSEELATYSINYRAQSGLAAASAKRSLTKIADDSYELTNKLSIALGGQLLAEIDEESQISWENNLLKPILYNSEQTGLNQETVAVIYDWDQSVARLSTSDGISSVDLKENTFDQLSHQLAIRQDFNKDIRLFSYNVINYSGLQEYKYNVIGEETIQTPLGSFESVKIERTEPVRTNRSTVFWLSTDWAGVLLQIEQIFNGSIAVTLKIQGGVVNEQPIIGKTD